MSSLQVDLEVQLAVAQAFTTMGMLGISVQLNIGPRRPEKYRESAGNVS
jgi:ribosomal protein S3